MMKKLYVKADTNDADYITELTPLKEEHIPIIKKLAKALKEFKPYEVKDSSIGEDFKWTHHHNFPNSEYSRTNLGEKTVKQLYVETGKLTQDELEIFLEEYCPHGENGIHTIEEIKIIKGKKEVLF